MPVSRIFRLAEAIVWPTCELFKNTKRSPAASRGTCKAKPNDQSVRPASTYVPGACLVYGRVGRGELSK